MNRFFLKFFFILSLIMIQTALFSQNYTTKKTAVGKSKKLYDEGVKHNILGETQKALDAFSDALKSEPTFIDAQIQQAAAFYKLGKFNDAETAFEKVEKIDSNYEPEVLFSLGNIELKQDKYAEASVHFEAYANSSKATATKKAKALKSAKDTKFMEVAMKNPVPFNPQSLGDKVNTPQYSEYLPALTADGETLVYTARVGRQEDFYMSKKVNGEWQKGVALTELNTDENEGAQCISPDGKSMFYTVCNRPNILGGCDILFSQLKEGKWTTPRGVAAINSTYWDAQPSITADSRTVYFASDRPGGVGGLDIWYVKYENGKWGEAKNMGAPINTPFDEQTPFIHPDGVTMYFTSEGHPGMGGKDIYLSRMQADGTWGEPQNLGYPINTKEDEGTLSVAIDGKTAFYARNISKTTTGQFNYDLFYFELPVADRAQPVTYVKAKVSDVDTKLPLSSRVEIIDLASQKTIIVSNTDEKGEFLVCLPFGKNYALNVSKELYLFQSENFNLTENATLDKPFQLDIKLQPIKSVEAKPSPEATVKPKEEKAIVLKNVFFDTDKSTLKPESFAELNKLNQLLTENATMRIELRGHTDSQGSDTHNLDLSDRRAKAVKDYLIQKGIAVDRLQSKGFGKSKPVDTNDTPQGRANNRRTEFVILK
jgi:outer membrane protein OmpA-like peptidoglycan-associated protein